MRTCIFAEITTANETHAQSGLKSQLSKTMHSQRVTSVTELTNSEKRKSDFIDDDSSSG